jgi:hypothetical protein
MHAGVASAGADMNIRMSTCWPHPLLHLPAKSDGTGSRTVRGFAGAMVASLLCKYCASM